MRITEASPEAARVKFVGLDIGTTTIKAVCFDFTQRASVVQVCSVPHALDVPEAGWAHQDASQALALSLSVLEQIHWQDVQGIGVSAAMHSLLSLDEAGQPLHPAWIWADLRSAEQARRLRLTDPELAWRTGTPVHPMAWPAKLLWMQEHQPDLLARAATFTGLKEYVVGQLTGSSGIMDRGMASATGCHAWQTNDWEGDFRGRFPQVVECTHVVGDWRGIPVVAGGGDGPLSNLGSGATRPGLAALSIGTSGALRACCHGPQAHHAGRVFCYHLLGDLWVRGGAISNGTLALDWVRGLTGFSGDNAALVEQALQRAGDDELVVLPYFAGERAPHWNPSARGAVVGLRLHHGPVELARAVLESITFAFKDVLGALELPELELLLASGGLTGSTGWMQLLANVLELPVATVISPEAGALGAALVASRALGGPGEVEIGIERRFEPQPQSRLRQLFERYQGLYDRLET